MKLAVLDTLFRGLTSHVMQRREVDGLKWGSLKVEMRGVVITWMATCDVIQQAIELGSNVIITHEPTFWNHWDDDDEFEGDPVYLKKVTLLKRQHINVYRVHDVWDNFPDYGVAARWADALGLGNRVAFDGTIPVHAIEPQPLADFAEHVRSVMKLPVLRMTGDPESTIERVAVGVGAWGGLHFVQLAMDQDADAFICGESIEWQAIRYAQEANFPVLTTNHFVSEHYGMLGLTDFIRERFPDLRVTYVDARDPFNYVHGT
jgi:putative NIF3 family GTP cyclohydrolase 1 type 2